MTKPDKEIIKEISRLVTRWEDGNESSEDMMIAISEYLEDNEIK